MDKAIVFTIILIVLAGFLFWGFQTGFFANVFSGPAKPTVLPAGIVEFYGQGCPHCKDVDDFIKANNIDQKVKWTKLEVWYNKANAELLGQVAQSCNISSNTVGVPFLYDPSAVPGQAGKCVIGETDVINFFKTQAGIK